MLPSSLVTLSLSPEISLPTRVKGFTIDEDEDEDEAGGVGKLLFGSRWLRMADSPGMLDPDDDDEVEAVGAAFFAGLVDWRRRHSMHGAAALRRRLAVAAALPP